MTDAASEADAVEGDRPAPPEPRHRRRRWPTWRECAPLALVAIAVVFNLWVLRAERQIVSYPNDSQTHLQMVQWAQTMLSHGDLPFDHWFAHLSLGSPYFVQYQSASAVLTGALGLAIGAQGAFALTLYLLLALWPICVYWTARLLGLRRWEAGVAAAVAPLLFSITGRGFEDQAFTWLGSGLWSELWAMWSLPLAIGFSWRFVSKRQYLFGAVFFTAATIAFHFLMAYLVALVLVVLVVLRPKDLVGRLTRAAIVGVGSVLAALWVLLPLLSIANWTAYNEFQAGTTIDNSYGAPKILYWLETGQIYDYGRFPIVTVLVAIGVVACIVKFRSDERARVLLTIWVLSLLLYFGRPTMSWAIDRLPGSKDLLFQRYIAGVHLAGIFLAGVGVVWLVELVGSLPRRVGHPSIARLARHRSVPIARTARAFVSVVQGTARTMQRSWAPLAASVIAIVVLVAALQPAWSEIVNYNELPFPYEGNGGWIGQQQAEDATDGTSMDALLQLASQLGGGRVYAGMPSNWGYDFKVGSVQAYIYMMNSNVDAIGFTLRTFSLMTDPEAWFDQYNLGDYSVLGIRYLLLPNTMKPPVPATLVTTAGPYKLMTVKSGGLVQVVDTTSPITASADDLGAATKYFLAGSLPDENVYPTIAFNGQPAAPPTLQPGEHVSGPAGRVVSFTNNLFWGSASATVVANRTSVVLLKASFDPGWSVTVDGVPARTEMVAPALLGVTVSPGRHVVVFTYHGYGSYPELFVLSLLALTAAGVGPAVFKRTRRPRRARSAAAPA